MSTGFLQSLTCKFCGQPMTPEDGWRFGWTEENERGWNVADHWYRTWNCPCGKHAEEHGVDDPPSDFAEGLLGTGEVDWYDNEGNSIEEDEDKDDDQSDVG